MAKKGSQLTVRTATEIQGGEFVILGYAGRSYQMTLDELKKFIGIIEADGGSVDLTQVSTDILPLADASKDIGSLEKRWKKVYSTALTVKAQSVDEEEVNIHDGGIEGILGRDIQWSIDGSGNAVFLSLKVNGADVATMDYVNNELSKYVTTDMLTKNYVSNTSLTEILKKYYESGYVDFLLSSKASTGDLNKTNAQLGIVQTDVATLKSYFQDTDDVDDIINKWRELEAFLAGQTETSTLAELLSVKADKETVVAINSRVTDLEDSDFVDIDSLRSTLESYYTKKEVDALLGEGGNVDLTGYVNEIAASGTGNGIASVSKDGSKLTFNKATFLTDATVPAARTTLYGGIKIGYKDNGKNYGVLLDDSGKAYVNVPWESYDLSKFLETTGGAVNYLQVSPAKASDSETINIGVTANEISGTHGNGTVDWKINSNGAWIGANQLATQSWVDGKGYLTASSSLASANLDKNTITIAGASVSLGESITQNQLIANLGLKGLAFKDSIDLSGYQSLITSTNKLAYSLISGTPTLATVATSGSYNDLTNKPTIPSAITESTVSGWGFTKNAGTITGIKMNGASKGTSGVVDLGTVLTSHQTIHSLTIKNSDESYSLTYTPNSSSLSITLGKSWVGLGNVENKSSATIRGEITSSNVTTALGYTPYNSANFTEANIKATLGISDWALASSKPTYTAAEVGALPSTTTIPNSTTVAAWGFITEPTLNNRLANYLSLGGGQIDGALTIAYGADLILKAGPSATGDSGDLAFYNYSGKEIGRIWHNAGSFCLRYAENDSAKEIIHSGNISDYALAKDSNGTVSLYGDIEVLSADNSVTIKNGSIISNTGGTDFWSIDDSGNGVLSRLTVEGGRDAKIILNNTDTESKYQYISFRQNGTEYGALGTFYDDNLLWNQNYILHSKNYSNYALPLTGGAVSGAFSIKTETTNDSFFQIRNSIFGGALFYGGIAEGEAVRIEAANGEGSWIGRILRLWLNGDVEVQGKLMTFNGDSYIHSGNIGSYAVTSTTLNDFPRLNGTSPSGASATGTWDISIHGAARRLISPYYYTEDEINVITNGTTAAALFGDHYSFSAMMKSHSLFNQFATVWNFSAYERYGGTQLSVLYNTQPVRAALRTYSQSVSGWGDWREIAFTDSTVANASKLGGIDAGSYFYAKGTGLINNEDANDYLVNGSYLNQTGNGSNNINFPQTYSIFVNFTAGPSNYVSQLSLGTNQAYYRTKIDNWGGWIEFVTSNNIGSYAVTPSNLESTLSDYPLSNGTRATGTWGIDISGSANRLEEIIVTDLNSAPANRIFTMTSGYGSADGNKPTTWWVSGITFRMCQNSSYRTQLCTSDSEKLYYRVEHAGSWTDWKTIAFTDSNVASADYATSAEYATNSSKLYSTDDSYKYGASYSYYGYLTYNTTYNEWDFKVSPATPPAVHVYSSDKLRTARTIWGQSFDGSGDVSGTLWLYRNNGYYSYLLGDTSGITIDSYQDGVGYLPIKLNPYAGNVGIGTANPNTKLHVVGGAKIEGALSTYGITATTTAATDAAFTHYVGSTKLWWVSSYNNCANFHTALYVQSGSSPIKVATVNDLSSYLLKAGDTISGSLTFSSTSGSHIIGNSNSEIIFQPSSDTSGANIPLKIAKTGSSTYTMYCDESEVYDLGTSSYKWNILYCRSASQSSDATLKNILGNVQLTTSQIANAPAVNFTWKNGGAKDVGTIAQYWKDVLPEVVSGEEGSYGMNYAVLGVVSSIILARNIETHEQRISRLEKEISDLQKELNALVNNE